MTVEVFDNSNSGNRNTLINKIWISSWRLHCKNASNAVHFPIFFYDDTWQNIRIRLSILDEYINDSAFQTIYINKNIIRHDNESTIKFSRLLFIPHSQKVVKINGIGMVTNVIDFTITSVNALPLFKLNKEVETFEEKKVLFVDS
ncbi:hypothetical protein RF11_11080 [Thelohanellus kitauei]|uniref:Uncharacterized protein n=1 Tax=Thelohanellus kitauei TaxID=669202 RepID=A0A0C2MZ64_THEKT|nr:hypothetical protein RF11_11080 [Thelohanellus kitauei]